MRPAAGPTIEGFNGKSNKGIDIGGKAGDPIWAAADGQVVYVGSQLRGYGNMVIVKHNDTFLTAYAHARAVLVAPPETSTDSLRSMLEGLANELMVEITLSDE